jgi:hypothetical protein
MILKFQYPRDPQGGGSHEMQIEEFGARLGTFFLFQSC